MKDLMARDVVSGSANSKVSDATQLLLEHGIRAAPVVNEFNRRIGVLSRVDLANRGWDRMRTEDAATPAGTFAVVRESCAVGFRVEHVTDELMQNPMAQAVQTICQNQIHEKAAACMITEPINRLVDLGDAERPAGELPSLDLFAATYAGDEDLAT